MAPSHAEGKATPRKTAARQSTLGKARTPGRRAAAGLTREVLVDAAKRIVRQEGTDGLTMRRLADELGVAPMAAYHHVRNRDELLSLVVDAAFRDQVAATAPPDDASWDEGLRYAAHLTFDTLAAYPGLGVFVQERPLSPYLRDRSRKEISLLTAAGLPEDDAAKAQASFSTFMFGVCSMESSLRPLKRPRRTTTAILVDVPIHQFIDFGVDLLIEGIRAQLRATA